MSVAYSSYDEGTGAMPAHVGMLRTLPDVAALATSTLPILRGCVTLIDQPSDTEGAAANERPAFAAFESRDDLEQYGSNSLLLFAAQLKLGFDDVDSFAANSLTDGNNDKKCDLVTLSPDGQRLIVAQGYVSTSDKTEAPANKASDLNTGVAWLLSGPLEDLPETLRSAAGEAREALRAGGVREMQIWYVHNLPESKNVDIELQQAAQTADSIIRRDFPEASVDVSCVEIGRKTLEEEYRRTQVPILVADEVEFPVPGGFTIQSDGWRAYSTAISAGQLRNLWLAHKTRLMSPNIRDYLGVVRTTGNINFGIKETAKSQPSDFAIFNNGITVLVHDYQVAERENEEGLLLKVRGIGIVNGGQTTGALGSLAENEVHEIDSAQVMARFVKCTDTAVLGDIVRYNNTQNKVETADFRSKDPTQDRLRREFARIPDAEYRGGRRGGMSDAIVRKKSLLPDSSVAQSLAAFHGDPNLAYNETRTIWDNDGVYANVFRNTVTARHIVLTYGLFKAVERAKQNITKIPVGSRTDAQKKHASFFSARGANYLLCAAIAACIETILGKAVADSYSLTFSDNASPTEAMNRWQAVVDIMLSFSAQLQPATDQGLKTRERVDKAIQDFSAMIEATRSANPGPFDTLASLVLSIPIGDDAVGTT
jgi:hypothetical protein